MTSNNSNIQNNDQKWKLLEVGFWVGYLFLTTTIGATSELIERERDGLTVQLFEPFLWEYSSAIFTLLLIPAILLIERRFPFSEKTWKSSLAIHVFATVPYSLLHVTGMVWVRKAVYCIMGSKYDFGNVPVELLYEWRKDALTYFFIIAVVYGYRLFRAKKSGTAFFSEDNGKLSQPQTTGSFSVKQADKIFFISFAEIDWIESAGNYVLLHCGEKSYMLRSTMKSVEEKLANAQFVRVHRTSIVNTKKIKAIQTTRRGGGFVNLSSGHSVQLSRHYRNNLDTQM